MGAQSRHSWGHGTPVPVSSRHLCQTQPYFSGNSRCKGGKNFLAATIFPRKFGRCVKIERQNFLGKIVAATEFPVTTLLRHRGVDPFWSVIYTLFSLIQQIMITCDVKSA